MMPTMPALASSISQRSAKSKAMNQIAPLLSADRIHLDVLVDSKRQLFDWLGETAARETGLDARQISASLLAREKLGSTALGQQVAIPHGRIKRLKTAFGLLVRLAEPVEFDAPDGLSVGLMFVLLVPIQATDLHLQILGELAQVLGDAGLRQKIIQATDAQLVMQLLTDWQPWG